MSPDLSISHDVLDFYVPGPFLIGKVFPLPRAGNPALVQKEDPL